MEERDRRNDIYRRVFENAETAMFVFDDEGEIFLVNRAFERLSGLTRPDIEGKKRWTAFVNPADLDGILISHQELKREMVGASEQISFRFRGGQGRDMRILMTISPIEETMWRLAILRETALPEEMKDRAPRPGEPSGDAWETIQDGAAGAADEQMNPFYAHPDDRKRHESQWVESQKLEALGTLSDGIAHEFNNILMGIQGYVSLMHFQKNGKHPYDDKLQNIEQLIEKGANLTKQLLGFAQTGMYEVRTMDINPLLEESSEMFARTKREIKMHRHFQEDLSKIKADGAQLNQVFMNLFINAGQAMPAGGDLYIETRNVILTEEDTAPFGIMQGPYIEIIVRDTGVGMDESTRLRIFDPFFTTKEMGGGTGLGLAFVYGVIKNHGGMIRIASKKGEGATFKIYFPALAEEPPQEVKAPESVVSGKEAILVVDDEEINIDVMKEWLDILGYDVLTAQNGPDALALYRQRGHEIDLVILDMIMPGMNGGDVFDAMKEINPQVRAILSSGYSIDGKAKEILQRGVKAFIQKPFRIDSLAQKIKEVLSA